MENPISRQLLQALAAFCLGAAGGIFYDFLRVLRRRRRSRLFTALCDLLFSLVFCCGLFLLGFDLGLGELRLFMAIFAGLGAMAYFYTAGPFVRRAFSLACTGGAKVLSVAAIPAAMGWKLQKKFIFFVKNVFSYAKKRFTIYLVSKLPADNRRFSGPESGPIRKDGFNEAQARGNHHVDHHHCPRRVFKRHADKQKKPDRRSPAAPGSPPAGGHRQGDHQRRFGI
jgi:hypothetical protein